MKRILAAVVLAFILISQVSAAEPPANVVRVLVDDGGGVQSAGSGTLIRTDLVITNWHVVKDRVGVVRVLFPSQIIRKAEIVKTDRLWDFAILQFNPVALTPVELGGRPERGDIIVVGGYGSGQYASSSGKILGFYQPSDTAPADIIQVDTKVRNGDSGGPMLKDGKLVGVLFGTSDGTYGTSIDRIRQLLMWDDE